MRLKMERAQSTLEYGILVVVIVAALVAMRLYVQRALQAHLKALEDQVNAGLNKTD